MPLVPVRYNDFSGGVNESNEPERIGRNQLEESLDNDLIFGRIDRRLGWKPLHGAVDPFFPSTRHSHLVIASAMGSGITATEWTIQFMVVFERIRSETGSNRKKYALLSKQFSDGAASPTFYFAHYLYWIDASDSGGGGLYWVNHENNSPTFSKNSVQVASQSDLPAEGVPVMITLRKVINASDRDLECYLDDTLTGTASSIGTDSLDDITDYLGAWELGWSELDFGQNPMGEGGFSLDETGALTFGEFRLWDSAITVADFSDFHDHELPETERGDSLQFHIPMDSPAEGIYPPVLGAYNAIHPVTLPHLVAGGHFPCGFLIGGFGARLELDADPDYVKELDHGETAISSDASAASFFFSFSGIAYGVLPLVAVPKGTAPNDIFFDIFLFGTGGGSDLHIRIRWIDAGGTVQSETSTLSVIPGIPFTVSVHWDNVDDELEYVVTQSSTTMREVVSPSPGIHPDSSSSPAGLEDRPVFRFGAQMRAENATTIATGLGILDRILIRIGDHLELFDHEGKDERTLHVGDDEWHALDVIVQPPEGWAMDIVAPRAVTIDKGRDPDIDRGETSNFLRARWNPISSTYAGPYRIATSSVAFRSFDPPPVLWTGSLRLRSAPQTSELSLLIIPGGIYSIASGGALTVVGRDLPLPSNTNAHVFLALGFLAVQGVRNSNLFLFDGKQVFPAVPSPPRTVTFTPSASGSALADGTYSYYVSFYNGSSGQESPLFERIALTLSGGPNEVVIAWVPSEADDGTSLVRIYRTSIDDEFGASNLIAQVPVDDGSYTDGQATIQADDLQNFFLQASVGGYSAAYFDGRFWFSDPLAPEILYFSPVLRADRIEGRRIAPAPVRRLLGSKNSLFAQSEGGLFLVRGSSPQNYSLTDLHRNALPVSNEGTPPILEHPSGFLMYWSTRGILQEVIEDRRLISIPVEQTIDGFDMEKAHLFTVGRDPKHLCAYFTAVTSGSDEPDRMLIFALSRGEQEQALWQVWRVNVRFIGELELNDKSQTVFVIDGYVSTFENDFDGWDDSARQSFEIDVTASNEDQLTLPSSDAVFMDDELNSRRLYRDSTGETVRVAYNVGNVIYLADSLGTSISSSAGETFQIGRIEGTGKLREEFPADTNYAMSSFLSARGSGGKLNLTMTSDSASESDELDLATEDDRKMPTLLAARGHQISFAMTDKVSIDEVVSFFRPLKLQP